MRLGILSILRHHMKSLAPKRNLSRYHPYTTCAKDKILIREEKPADVTTLTSSSLNMESKCIGVEESSNPSTKRTELQRQQRQAALVQEFQRALHEAHENYKRHLIQITRLIKMKEPLLDGFTLLYPRTPPQVVHCPKTQNSNVRAPLHLRLVKPVERPVEENAEDRKRKREVFERDILGTMYA